MSLRTRILLYLGGIHLVLGGVAWLALAERPGWLLVAEGLFLVSLALGVMLARAFLVPLQLIRTGADLVTERDFTSTFRPVGQPEMDTLVAVYNRMIVELREERLRGEEQRQFLEKLVAASPTGVLVLDLDGRLASANPAAARILGLPPEGLPGLPLSALPTPFHGLGELPASSSCLVAVGERRFRATRSEFYDRGFVRGFLLLEELTAELRASEKAAYEKLIRLMSHEVNNSVGAVGSLLDSFRAYAAELSTEDGADLRAALTVAITRLENLRRFTQGFADVVRLPAPERRPCDVGALLQDLLLLLGPGLAERSITARWGRREDLPPVALDRNQLEQLAVNLFHNAAEAIGQHGEITVSWFLDGARPTLEILDTGPGLAPGTQDHLFTPFYSTKREGRGLGLTLAAEVARAHGFELTLENRTDGPRGARARLRMAAL